jgi:HEPN domain-containing protein
MRRFFRYRKSGRCAWHGTRSARSEGTVAMPTSADFWDLAKVRLEDAEALLSIQRWSCAYYVAGYAVECALKALIVRTTERTGTLFRDKKEPIQLLDSFYVHDLDRLFKAAELEVDFGIARGANPALDSLWTVVKLWKETSRYEQKSQTEAENLVRGINHDPDGVMKWLRGRW